MSTEAQPQTRPKPLPPKKRYYILLSHELAERFERVAKLRHGAKSAVVEEALDRRLNPEKYPRIGDALLRRLMSDRRVVSDVLESIALHNPDLLAALGDDRPSKVRPAPSAEASSVDPKPNGHSASPPQPEKTDA